jgi:hypothetical protein
MSGRLSKISGSKLIALQWTSEYKVRKRPGWLFQKSFGMFLPPYLGCQIATLQNHVMQSTFSQVYDATNVLEGYMDLVRCSYHHH